MEEYINRRGRKIFFPSSEWDRIEKVREEIGPSVYHRTLKYLLSPTGKSEPLDQDCLSALSRSDCILPGGNGGYTITPTGLYFFRILDEFFVRFGALDE